MGELFVGKFVVYSMSWLLFVVCMVVLVGELFVGELFVGEFVAIGRIVVRPTSWRLFVGLQDTRSKVTGSNSLAPRVRCRVAVEPGGPIHTQTHTDTHTDTYRNTHVNSISLR